MIICYWFLELSPDWSVMLSLTCSTCCHFWYRSGGFSPEETIIYLRISIIRRVHMQRCRHQLYWALYGITVPDSSNDLRVMTALFPHPSSEYRYNSHMHEAFCFYYGQDLAYKLGCYAVAPNSIKLMPGLIKNNRIIWAPSTGRSRKQPENRHEICTANFVSQIRCLIFYT